MNFLQRLFRSNPDPRAAVEPLWVALVDEARDPQWYRTCGVADTLEGRFDMVTLVLALAMIRMEKDAELAALSGPLTELFVEDMDGQLRQSGVGDLMVGKQIGKLMSTLGGRIGAMKAALATSDDESLEDAARRNVTLADETATGRLADRLRALAGRFEKTDTGDFLKGEFA